ncbi:MAG: acyltransferase [Firmicutes bacterium]|nr:acyltransferase [Bacillota bacterium]
MKEYKSFDKGCTLFVKGVAVILLLTHHTVAAFPQSYPIDILHCGINVFITAVTKVCVALFTVLSGYGLAKSFEKSSDRSIIFVLKHIKKLLINFWKVYVLVFLLSECRLMGFIYESPIKLYINKSERFSPFVTFVLDFFGLMGLFSTPTLNITWWYMETILFCYLMFPVLRAGIKKIPIFTLFAAAVPCIILGCLRIASIPMDSNDEIYYMFPFAMGIFVADRDILNRFIRRISDKYFLHLAISFVTMLVMMVFATQFSGVGYTFFAVSIVFFAAVLLKYDCFIMRWLKLLGEQSMNMFLIHSFLLSNWLAVAWIFELTDNIFIKVGVLTVLSYATAVLPTVLDSVIRRAFYALRAKKR